MMIAIKLTMKCLINMKKLVKVEINYWLTFNKL